MLVAVRVLSHFQYAEDLHLLECFDFMLGHNNNQSWYFSNFFWALNLLQAFKSKIKTHKYY